MITMDDSIKELLKSGLITAETARYHSENPELFGK
jgi:Tfp pilus assembly pilus retraction ATPase PilT